jgi:signal transduction histidine kinase
MRLKTGLAIFVVLVSVIFAALSVSLIRMSDLLDRESRKLIAAGESIRLAEELKSRLLVHNRNAFLYTLNNDPDRLQGRRTQRAQVTSLLETIGQLANSREEEVVLAEVRRQIATYFDKRGDLTSLGVSPVEQYTQISQDVDEALAVVDMLTEVNRKQMNALMETIGRRNTVSDSIAVLLLLLGGFVLLFIIIGIVFSVARPLTSLADIIAKYAGGDSSARSEIKGLQEIRVIASNFNSMADRLEERRQEQLRFIASIAHDLRNPLQSMSVASALLAIKCVAEDRELAGMVSRQVKHLDRLVGDLLDISHIEAGRLELELGDQDIGLLIRDAVELYRAGSDLHSFRIEIADDPIICRCDGRRIAQVINNLVSNAVKYSPNGGVVKVKAWKKEDEFVISVADEGIGIAPQDFDRIFKPFYRTKATKGTIPGIGLGLSASRRIVEAHGGRMHVESTPGKGSVFYVCLPVG